MSTYTISVHFALHQFFPVQIFESRTRLTLNTSILEDLVFSLDVQYLSSVAQSEEGSNRGNEVSWTFCVKKVKILKLLGCRIFVT